MNDHPTPPPPDSLPSTTHGEAATGQASDRITPPPSDIRRTYVGAPPGTSSPANADPWTQGRSTLGRYRLVRPLGQGSVSRVYLASDTQLGREVALKIPSPEALRRRDQMERFWREARAAGRLRHPNICPVYEVGEVDGIQFLVMAYIKGKPLSSLLTLGQRAPGKRAALLVRKLALAMHEAHSLGILHRDLCPSNIMLDDRGEPVILDFGIARQLGPEQSRLTQAGTVLGTPVYQAPELLLDGSTEATKSTDVYSLGVILYELLSGRPPFVGSYASVLVQAARDNPAPLRESSVDVTPALEEICLRAMAKSPSRRYRDMAELAADLQMFLNGLPLPNRSMAAEPRTTPIPTGPSSTPSPNTFTPDAWGQTPSPPMTPTPGLPSGTQDGGPARNASSPAGNNPESLDLASGEVPALRGLESNPGSDRTKPRHSTPDPASRDVHANAKKTTSHNLKGPARADGALPSPKDVSNARATGATSPPTIQWVEVDEEVEANRRRAMRQEEEEFDRRQSRLRAPRPRQFAHGSRGMRLAIQLSAGAVVIVIVFVVVSVGLRQGILSGPGDRPTATRSAESASVEAASKSAEAATEPSPIVPGTPLPLHFQEARLVAGDHPLRVAFPAVSAVNGLWTITSMVLTVDQKVTLEKRFPTKDWGDQLVMERTKTIEPVFPLETSMLPPPGPGDAMLNISLRVEVMYPRLVNDDMFHNEQAMLERKFHLIYSPGAAKGK